jgi:phosphatidylglycerophosphate synthase
VCLSCARLTLSCLLPWAALLQRPNDDDEGTSTASAAERASEAEAEANGWQFERVVNVANGISLARGLSSPLLYYWIVNVRPELTQTQTLSPHSTLTLTRRAPQGQLEYAVAGLFVAGVSDWADGYVAKSYDFQSVLGSYLDPLADKAVIVATTLGR